MSKFLLNLLIFCLIGIVVVKGLSEEETKTIIKSIATGCKPESGAKDSDIEDVLDNKFARTKEGKCLRFCVMKKMGQMDDKGKLKTLPILKSLSENTKTGGEIMNQCVDIDVDNDPCEAMDQYEHCFNEKATAVNFKDLMYT